MRFGGPDLEFGRSNVMGDSHPTIEIVNQGSHNGAVGDCLDMEIEGTDTGLTVAWPSTDRTWTLSSGSTLGVLQVGDRIRIDNVDTLSATYFAYTIMSLTSTTITLDFPMQGTDGTKTPYQLFKIDTPTVEYSIKNAQAGEDSYKYDVYFTGRHLTDVYDLTVSMCTGFAHFDGMRHGVLVEPVVEGSSSVVQTISMSSTDAPVAGDKVWKMVFNDPVSQTQIIIPNDAGINNGDDSDGFEWGITAADLETQFDAVMGTNFDDVDIVRSGYGTPEEGYGYSYTFTFNDADRIGSEEAFSAVGMGQLSSPLYIPVNKHTNQDGNYTLNTNDMTVSGAFASTGVDDYDYMVRIQGDLLTDADALLDFIICKPN